MSQINIKTNLNDEFTPAAANVIQAVTEVQTQVKAERIVSALECYVSGHWRWMTMEPGKRLDAAWIAKRYEELRPQGFADASCRARIDFVKAVLIGNPDLVVWHETQRFYTCPNCSTERIAAAPSVECACGTTITNGNTVHEEARQWVMLQFYLGEVSEGWAAAALSTDRLALRGEVIARFGALHREDGQDE
jgi:hypothetical protein